MRSPKQYGRAGQRNMRTCSGRGRRDEVLTKQWRDVAMRLAIPPAKTMEGLIAKFAMIAPGTLTSRSKALMTAFLRARRVTPEFWQKVRDGRRAHD